MHKKLLPLRDEILNNLHKTYTYVYPSEILDSKKHFFGGAFIFAVIALFLLRSFDLFY